jgi:hypothetical protein
MSSGTFLFFSLGSSIRAPLLLFGECCRRCRPRFHQQQHRCRRLSSTIMFSWSSVIRWLLRSHDLSIVSPCVNALTFLFTLAPYRITFVHFPVLYLASTSPHYILRPSFIGGRFLGERTAGSFHTLPSLLLCVISLNPLPFPSNQAQPQSWDAASWSWASLAACCPPLLPLTQTNCRDRKLHDCHFCNHVNSDSACMDRNLHNVTFFYR